MGFQEFYMIVLNINIYSLNILESHIHSMKFYAFMKNPF
jgi:hypothetical protein